MAKNNYLELNKITLARWVDKASEHSLKKENINSRFKVFVIWPLNLVAMVGKFGSNELFILAKEADHESGFLHATN
jgi:nitrate reductase NapE component